MNWLLLILKQKFLCDGSHGVDSATLSLLLLPFS